MAKQGKHAAAGSDQQPTEAFDGVEDQDVIEDDVLFSDDAYATPYADPAAYGGIQYGSSVPMNPKRKHGKVIAIVAGVIVGILAIIYVAGALFFTGRFFPNTYAGEVDLSMQPVDVVRQQLDDVIENYELTVEGQGFSLELNAEETGINVDAAAVVASMHGDASPWAWPVEIFMNHDETNKLAASYNENGLEEAVRAAVDAFNAGRSMPVNATIAFDEATGAFSIVDEQPGTALSADLVIKAVDEAVVSLDERVELTGDDLLKPTVLSTEPKLKTAVDQANAMVKADVTLTLAGDVAGEVNAPLISQWVVLGEDLSATLNQDALTAWVDQLVSQCNTVGTERTYTRADGKVITVSGGVYGWEVDRDTLLTQIRDAVSAGTVATQEIPCSSHGSAYNGVGGRDWGNRYCDIDLSEQHVRFYDETGALVWESDCVSGTPDGEHDTSVGVFWLNAKESPSMLIGYENGKKLYETQVSYWMPFDGNSIGLHDANWQPDFGGDMYKRGYGSHGCVNLPVDKAGELYNIIQPGDCVVSHW